MQGREIKRHRVGKIDVPSARFGRQSQAQPSGETDHKINRTQQLIGNALPRQRSEGEGGICSRELYRVDEKKPERARLETQPIERSEVTDPRAKNGGLEIELRAMQIQTGEPSVGEDPTTGQDDLRGGRC